MEQRHHPAARSRSSRKLNLGFSEMNDSFTLRQLIAEFIGTYVYIAITLLSGIPSTPNFVTMAFANGLMYASMLQVFGNISGAHLNPAVTLGALVCERIRLCKALCYMLVQTGGAVLGALTTYYLLDSSIRGKLTATIPNSSISSIQSVGLELLMTFVVVSVFLSVGTFNLTGPLATGLSVTGCQCAALGLTWSMNPVKSLGPAVAMNIWKDHWIYWVGPLSGGLIAGLIRRIFQWHRMLRPSVDMNPHLVSVTG